MPFDTIERELRDACVRLADAVAAVRHCHRHFLDDQHAATAVAELTSAHPWGLAGFGDPAWDRYRPDMDAPAPDGVRVGAMRAAPGLPPLPAVARLAGHGHLTISETGDAERAHSLLAAIVLRLAVATRPGTMRFALADPVGQGRHLSAFLRLPPQLRVGAAVAVGQDEIESLLARLTRHVTEVTQTRLTNLYDSIAGYNAAADGTAVPYHVLALAGFPAGITDHALELLSLLARNGPRAGVHIVATVSRAAPLANAIRLSLTAAGELTWDEEEHPASMTAPDQMPAAARANAWLDAVGAAASTADRDLAFRRIMIAAPRRWAAETTDGLDVRIGVDSKGEPQHFRLGVRGVHHGLVGGDVRMGKTNLLHVLICQLALRYPPEELELYLLDFKEVEFDAYLTERLPHARAITSRTDREFGLSMLYRFHDEIDRRARLCRQARVTDLPGYRHETGQVLPRALVIMDEFQVLFAAEDRVAVQAARLLADIAKRGAAFGLHLLLATQSPGGPLTGYLRPVYEQMALRIALGCTQPSVSQAILGEGNDTATRLAQTGEAIYNDRRGEGANPVMRIAFLPTRERLELIGSIRDLGGGRRHPPPASFDPDAPADFAAHPPCAADAGPVRAWLGEAIEIKPATTATFDRYVRSNLLIVGGEEHGHGLLLATLLSAALQRSAARARFTIADFARPSSGYHGFFEAAARALPHQVRLAGHRTAGDALDELAADLDARLAEPAGPPRPDWFFLAAGLHRWHELIAEGDYGRPSQAGALLTYLAEKGPDAGIHVVAWTDSYATAERAVRRSGIGHFGLRAVLRVLSPAESDALLGVPAAASLDDDRALFRDTEWPSEQVEKFKPYSIGSLRAVAATLATAAPAQR